MAREVHTSTIKIDQKPPIIDDIALRERDGGIVEVDASALNKDQLEELAFMEEPITIRIEPSPEKHAASAQPVWCNGKGAEVLMKNGRFTSISEGGQWYEIKWIPVGKVVTLKRKYVSILLGAKVDSIQTVSDDIGSESPRNEVRRVTASVCTFSIIEDRSPRGIAWMQEIRRRNT